MAKHKKRTFSHEQPSFEPVNWKELIGYTHLFDRFQSVRQRNRFPAGLLIEGREGLGKRVFAAALSSLFYCETKNACGQCSGCADVLGFRHEDLLWLEEDGGTIKVDMAQRVQEHLEIQASQHAGSEARIVVIVDFDKMTRSAANRLLKIIEEPPEHAYVIMTSSRPAHILPTILSRVVRLKVEPPKAEDMIGWLRERAGDQNPDLLQMAMKYAGQAPGKARGFMEASERILNDFRLLEGAFEAQDPFEALDKIEESVKQPKVSAIDLAHRIEVILNQRYRSELGLKRDFLENGGHGSASRQSSLTMRKEWRELLRRVKALSGGGKVPLNAQLVAESWILARFG